MTVDIAIIDSGINGDHPHVRGVGGGLSLGIDENGDMVQYSDYRDDIGHGTAIAGVIRHSAPLSMLHAVKIFYHELKASGTLLIEALKWAVSQRFKIIHLSLGTEMEAFKPELKALCEKAHAEDRIVIAAARHPDDEVFPAAFETAIGVCRHHGCDSGDRMFHHPNAPIEIGACGWPRQIPGVPKERNFQGHSFAAAHVTARAARLLEKYPDAGPEWVKKRLIEAASSQ